MTCGDFNTDLGPLPKNAHSDKRCKSTADPTNVVFRSESSRNLGSVLREIVNVDTVERWRTPSFLRFATARDQWMEIDQKCKKQSDQVVTGDFWDRFHIRIWDGPGGHVIAGAHNENLLTIGGNLPLPHPHQPGAFESGRDSICDDFQALGKSVVRSGIWMDNYQREPYCSGWAALIG
jgi:hypothetical protein